MRSAFIFGDTWLHRLHPLTKLCAAILVIVAAYCLPGIWTAFGLFIALVLIAGGVRVARSFMPILLLGMLPIVFSIFLIQGILFPPEGAQEFARYGFLSLTWEGLAFAWKISSRLLVFSTAILLLLSVTHRGDLVLALQQHGMPRWIGYVLLVTMQLIPEMLKRAKQILDVQRSRGLNTRGLRRITALFPLLAPLMVGALLDVEERAVAIETRAYLRNGPTTSLRQLHDTSAQRASRWLMIAAIAALAIWTLLKVVWR
jgi:energy-coupling factor transport system permease protein